MRSFAHKAIAPVEMLKGPDDPNAHLEAEVWRCAQGAENKTRARETAQATHANAEAAVTAVLKRTGARSAEYRVAKDEMEASGAELRLAKEDERVASALLVEVQADLDTLKKAAARETRIAERTAVEGKLEQLQELIYDSSVRTAVAVAERKRLLDHLLQDFTDCGGNAAGQKFQGSARFDRRTVAINQIRSLHLENLVHLIPD